LFAAQGRRYSGFMCNQYSPPDPQRIAQYFDVQAPPAAYKRGLGPWSVGPFVRIDQAEPTRREAVLGQWALIGDNAKEARSKARIMTNNARSESNTAARAV
jgi:hypothetical protein